MVVAVRIARAKAKKDVILFCGYHGWHDWYLASNLADEKSLDGHLLPGLNPLGVPRALKGTSYPFSYNDTESFLSLIKEHKDNVGVVVLESIRNHYPQKEFLSTIRDTTQKLGIVLIVDEISAGFRLNPGGAHLVLGLEPDIAVFAKGMSNGYPMGAVIGKKEVMEVAQDTFISSTYWTDRIGPAAAIANITKFIKNNVHDQLRKSGQAIQNIWKKTAQDNNLPIEVSGIPPLSHFSVNHPEPLILKTLFTQLMLKKGFLASTAYYASFAHTEKQINKYEKAVKESFAYIAGALKEGNLEKHLIGPVCHSGFRRLT
jgi:glutamate-1-semialdehyde 2,1-aminomutase